MYDVFYFISVHLCFLSPSFILVVHRIMIHFLLLIGLVFSVLVKAEVISPSHTYNVTLPEPNAPYVAGQMLPISYTLPDEANLPNCK